MPDHRPPAPAPRTEVTAAGIARLAGVGRAAVSNWRRRHPDFPRPVGGSDTSPAFDLAEVERWLREQGKLGRVPLRERVWQAVEREPGGAQAALLLAGAVLLLVHERPAVRAELTGPGDDLSAGLSGALAEVLGERLGDGHPVPAPGAADLVGRAPLVRAAADLAADLGPGPAYEFLLGRHLEAGPRQYVLTPAELAELMADLAGPADLVLDPACGYGGLLRAAPGPAAVHGQESDPELAALTALRLALRSAGPVRVLAGDSLRADAHPRLLADAVVTHPPFNERAWGHEELTYDTRWEYGLPPRAESELAWVQHALAHVRPAGTVVVLMPPAAAARRSGRRIRADLLRRGTLRAVVALPAGAAPPYGIPLHLWLLRRPDPAVPPPQHLLLVDAGQPEPDGRRPAWPALRQAVLGAWRTFEETGTSPERPGVSRTVPVIDLLDDDVDITPARHLPRAAVAGGEAALSEVRDLLAGALRRSADLAPAAGPRGTPARWPLTSVGELARAGALVMRTGGAGAGPPGGPAVLTEHDIVTGAPPSGELPEGAAEDPVVVRAGDVVLPAVGRGTVTRVIDEALAGCALGRHVYLLRPDPATLDPWFLAGFLRGTANSRQAGVYTSTASRLDVRRLQVPRLPLAEQRRYGARFRALADFEAAHHLAFRLGEQLVQGLYDGLTDGSVTPD